MKGTIRFALGIAGVPEATINDIDKALPAAERLLVAYTKLSPELASLKPDLDTVAPVLIEIINFVKGE